MNSRVDVSDRGAFRHFVRTEHWRIADGTACWSAKPPSYSQVTWEAEARFFGSPGEISKTTEFGVRHGVSVGGAALAA